MLEDAVTKEMFRVMDGFLVLMSVLSTIQPAHSWPVAEPGDQIVTDVLEATRLVFAILSESLHRHAENVRFFEVRSSHFACSLGLSRWQCVCVELTGVLVDAAQHSVGYESLSQAVLPLLSDAKTVDETLGFIVAFALHDFSLSNLFQIDDTTDYAFIDQRLQSLSSKFSTIRHAGATKVLYNSIPSLAVEKENESRMALRRYYIYKLLERLSAHNHRNFAILNTLHLVGPLFEAYHSTSGSSTNPPSKAQTPNPSVPSSPSPSPLPPPLSITTASSTLPKPERQVILKLLKRLLELGSTSEEARLMFQRALMKTGETLNGDVLEVLRAGMKTRWPEHFSLEGPAALVVPCEPSKGLPSSGFTFMVSVK